MESRFWKHFTSASSSTWLLGYSGCMRWYCICRYRSRPAPPGRSDPSQRRPIRASRAAASDAVAAHPRAHCFRVL
eukprot:1145584-Prorocentrum_minimum.AAC.2